MYQKKAKISWLAYNQEEKIKQLIHLIIIWTLLVDLKESIIFFLIEFLLTSLILFIMPVKNVFIPNKKNLMLTNTKNLTNIFLNIILKLYIKLLDIFS